MLSPQVEISSHPSHRKRPRDPAKLAKVSMWQRGIEDRAPSGFLRSKRGKRRAELLKPLAVRNEIPAYKRAAVRTVLSRSSAFITDDAYH